MLFNYSRRNYQWWRAADKWLLQSHFKYWAFSGRVTDVCSVFGHIGREGMRELMEEAIGFGCFAALFFNVANDSLCSCAKLLLVFLTCGSIMDRNLCMAAFGHCRGLRKWGRTYAMLV